MCSMFRGSDTETQPCGAPVCLYPRPSCCSGFVKTLNRTARTYECVSNESTTTPTTTTSTTTTSTTTTTTTTTPPDCTVIGPQWTYWAEDRMCYGTIGSGGNYYTMEQYKAGACNTFHSGAEPASFTSQEQWDYLVGADGKIVVDQPLWIGLEFDAAGNLAWINGQPVTWVRVPAALGNTGTPGFAFDDNWMPDDPENPAAGFPDRTIICRAPPPP
ncbi:hypothetical protein WR25_05524 [Diploscapter pachys]|uniref:C-type lectin domain-containing protein n=1 Tax=Diploscapter pachys TaxID=2018661 RepID=A0A2A2L9Q7_9BILA|nr:hypothetical protein WR25_05524 [Diploscapter pachys]